jgi:DNA replication protein DnaC
MFTYIEEEGEIVAVPDLIKQQEAKIKKYQYFLIQSGLPEFYHNINFEDYKGDHNSEVFKKVKYYADNIDKSEFKHVSLFIHGKHSTQKTAVACNILKEAMKKGLTCRFILAGVLIDKLMKLQGFHKDEELYEEIKQLKKCDVLLIDDCFDPDKSLMWKNSVNNSMIIAEYDIFFRDLLSRNTKIIITSNFDKSIIKQYYGISLFELIDRNFVSLEFTESIKELRKLSVESSFENMYRRSSNN